MSVVDVSAHSAQLIPTANNYRVTDISRLCIRHELVVFPQRNDARGRSSDGRLLVSPTSRPGAADEWYVYSRLHAFLDNPTLTIPDLEIYTTRTDAFGLITLAALLLVMCDAVPLPKSLVGSSFTESTSEKAKKPYARAMILLTMFHHITTGIGSYQHWIKPSHRTIAMDIGVFGNIAFTALGVAALVYGLRDEDSTPTSRKSK